MPKFFIDKSSIMEDIAYISGEDVNHIKKVLRLSPGDNIIISDGCGYDYNVVIEAYEPQKVVTRIVSVKENCSEPPISVALFQGIPKSDKMDFIIQKSVELGVNQIIPVITERTVVKIDTKKDIGNKTSRWQRISLEASKQCNRGIIPRIAAPVSFNVALEMSKCFDLRVIPYENENRNRLTECLHKENQKQIAVFIGPEGGFSDSEIKKAVDNGLKTVTLGPRIVRTETAGIMTLSILMFTLGDVG